MKQSITTEWLSNAVQQATRSAKFCVAGCLPAADPGIVIAGLGPLKLPLKRTTAKELIGKCRPAPYGKGTETLVNPKVRNTFELDPKKFSVSDEWTAAIARATGAAAEQLGLPSDQLEARLYKLLVYEKGGFFLPHRDSEKHDRMVASMIVVLPNPFEGGALIVRHGAVEQRLTLAEAARGEAASYAAFYADCEHEVQRVTHGVRLCLAYNLVLRAKRTKATAAKPAEPKDSLAAAIAAWVATRPAEPLVFALAHHYTQRGLSLELLKGTDRQLAAQVQAAAAKADCVVHLAQVARHLLQFADDGSFEDSYSWSRRAPRHALEIGETYEDELSGTEWADLHGKKQPWGEIAFDLAAIVAAVPIDDWKPTKEEFEGYTGNAGNTLDRWYHRSALVVWHRDHHFDVIASAGATVSLPLFNSMATKLAKTPKQRYEAARQDCIRFARAIIRHWPHTNDYRRFGEAAAPERGDFPERLLTLHDPETIALFLTRVAECDPSQPLKSFVLSACREFGWRAFAEPLKQFFAARPTAQGRHEIPERDLEWLAAFCCDKAVDPEKAALAHELCALAVKRFCEPLPAYYPTYGHRAPAVAAKSLPLLLEALLAGGREAEVARVIQFVRAAPETFTLDDCQVPSLKTLIPWSQKRFGSVPSPLESWLESVRQELEAAVATPPAPPADWARPADIACSCQVCAQLKAFLADPANEVGRIPAREDLRQHLISKITQHQCDVKYTLERKKSPYSLVLTKTSGSFERAVKRLEANQKLLRDLPPSP